MNKIMELLRTEYPVKVYQWVTIWIVLIVLWAGGIIGAVIYFGDRNEASLRDAAAAQLAADLAQYQNARDERLRCEQRVESRGQLRDVFIGIASRLGADEETIDLVSTFLDDQYPSLSLSDCPPEPTIPQGVN